MSDYLADYLSAVVRLGVLRGCWEAGEDFSIDPSPVKSL
jgi:hypothetical protein